MVREPPALLTRNQMCAQSPSWRVLASVLLLTRPSCGNRVGGGGDVEKARSRLLLTEVAPLMAQEGQGTFSPSGMKPVSARVSRGTPIPQRADVSLRSPNHWPTDRSAGQVSGTSSEVQGGLQFQGGEAASHRPRGKPRHTQHPQGGICAWTPASRNQQWTPRRTLHLQGSR